MELSVGKPNASKKIVKVKEEYLKKTGEPLNWEKKQEGLPTKTITVVLA